MHQRSAHRSLLVIGSVALDDIDGPFGLHKDLLGGSASFIARAGSGMIYAHCLKDAPEIPLSSDFATMTQVKEMFDPERLLNRGRLYGRL